MIEALPALVGAAQFKVTCPLAAVAVRAVGAPGAAPLTGGVAVASLEGGEAPTELTASTS